MLLTEAIKPRIVAIYPGRFQPMGKHHFTAYKHLVSKFGATKIMDSYHRFGQPNLNLYVAKVEFFICW